MWLDFETILYDRECAQKLISGHSLTTCLCDTTTLDEDFPMIEFGMGANKMRLMPSDYMLYDKQKGLDVQECAVGFTQNDQEKWVLGNSFMRKFLTVYDLKEGRIGFITDQLA